MKSLSFYFDICFCLFILRQLLLSNYFLQVNFVGRTCQNLWPPILTRWWFASNPTTPCHGGDSMQRTGGLFSRPLPPPLPPQNQQQALPQLLVNTKIHNSANFFMLPVSMFNSMILYCCHVCLRMSFSVEDKVCSFLKKKKTVNISPLS